jgi:hypothetical protein
MRNKTSKRSRGGTCSTCPYAVLGGAKTRRRTKRRGGACPCGGNNANNEANNNQENVFFGGKKGRSRRSKHKKMRKGGSLAFSSLSTVSTNIGVPSLGGSSYAQGYQHPVV